MILLWNPMPKKVENAFYTLHLFCNQRAIALMLTMSIVKGHANKPYPCMTFTPYIFFSLKDKCILCYFADEALMVWTNGTYRIYICINNKN